MNTNPLVNSPPRLSDLHGDERTAALRQRADRAKEDWMRNRGRIPLLTRLAERFL